MSIINSANAYSISQILTPESRVRYVIPKYQREYTWKKEQVEELINDLLDNEEGYFLGTMLCVNKTTDTVKENILEIIDGQQRLTTISLLYAAIYNRYSEMNCDNDEDFMMEKGNLKYRLILKNNKNKNQIRLILSSQNNNFEDYKFILKEIGIYKDPVLKKPANLGNRRLYRAYNYILNRLSSLSDNEIRDFLKKIDSAIIVKIEVHDYSDAYTLFESLNNRGLPLSAMDLIKNKLLSEIDKRYKGKGKKTPINIDSAFELWEKITANIEDYKIQERFLRQYYNAFRYDKKIRVKNFPRATKSCLIKIYERLIENDPVFILNELVEKSDIYNQFVSPNQDNKLYYDLSDLLHVGAAPSYTLLLYLFSKYSNNMKFLRSVIKFLVKYFVRRNMTNFPGTKDLDRIFINLVDACEKKDNINADFIISYLTNPQRFADIETFKNKLLGDIYADNAAMARFILCKIEESHMTNETWKDLWVKEKGRYVWTIEHIFPEGPNIPKSWINMIANGDKKKAEEFQKECVHKLGNLTLTAYNRNLSNLSFERKRDRKDNKGDFIGYKNGLYLNKMLARKKKWTISDIEKRTKKLVKEALKLFAVKGEKVGDLEFSCSDDE